jgi:hypothetical protein
MTLKKENVEPKKEPTLGDETVKSPEPPKAEKNDSAAIAELRKQIEELKKEKNTPVSSNGMNANDMAKIIDAIAKKSEDKKELDLSGAVYEEDIPPDDYLDQKDQVVFYAPGTGYFIFDDKRKGAIVKLPYGKQYIHFEYDSTKVTQQGKYQTTSPFSKYVCKSKKELEWLRVHTKNGTYFHESISSAVNVDLSRAAKLSKVMNQLVDYSLPDLIKATQGHGLTVDVKDAPAMRSALAKKIVDNEISAEEQRTKIIRQATNTDKSLLSPQE